MMKLLLISVLVIMTGAQVSNYESKLNILFYISLGTSCFPIIAHKLKFFLI